MLVKTRIQSEMLESARGADSSTLRRRKIKSLNMHKKPNFK